MSGTVSADTIGQHLCQPPWAYPQTNIGIVAGQTFTVDGPGLGLQFILSGDTSQGLYADAHLRVLHAGVFQSHVQLGAFSDLTLSGIIASSYTYDPAGGLLTLYQGDLVADRVLLRSNGGIQVASFDPVGDTPGAVIVSTGRFSLEESLRHAIGVHQPPTT